MIIFLKILYHIKSFKNEIASLRMICVENPIWRLQKLVYERFYFYHTDRDSDSRHFYWKFKTILFDRSNQLQALHLNLRKILKHCKPRRH